MDEGRAAPAGGGLMTTRLATERTLSVVRILGSAGGLVQLLRYPGELPSGVWPTALSLVLILGASGAVSFAATRRITAARDADRLAASTLALDVVIVVALTLLFAFDADGRIAMLVLVLALEAALKYQFHGAIGITGVVVAEEGARALLRTHVWGIEAGWEEGGFTVGLTALIAVVVGTLARTADQGREAAASEARRAQALAEVAEASNRDLIALSQIILAGIEHLDDALQRMVDEVSAQLAFPAASIVLRDDAGEVYLAAAHGTPAEEIGEPALVDAGGPLDRALTAGIAQFARTAEVASLQHRLPGTRTQMVAPLRLRGRTLGALVVESTDPDSFSVEQLGPLQRVADQMALVVEAARSLVQEAQLAERYRELDRLKTDFIAITSHELRTPLTPILGFSEVLLRDDSIPEARRKEFVEAIVRQARRLTRLVDDLGTVTRLDAGTLEIALRPTPVDQVVATVLDRVGAPHLVHADGPVGMWVVADPDQLVQVLLRLVRNGLEHGEGSPVELTWQPNAKVGEIRVRDHGPGISVEHRDRVFDRFYKVGDVMAHQRGSGLGLTIARELARACGGELELDPVVTPGACFVVRLPLPATGPVRRS